MQLLRKLPAGKPDLSTAKLRSKREQLVSEVMDKICSTDNFGRYEYAPPTMVSGCNRFIKEYEEQLETYLYKGGVTELFLRQELCLHTKECKQLWTAEEFETKRDRSPEEAQAEREDMQKRHKEEKDRQAAEEKEKKRKEKAEAAKKKKDKEAANQAEPKKDEL